MHDLHSAEMRSLQGFNPEGLCLVLVEVYMDESGTGEGDAVHCLAGYMVKPCEGMEMAERWKYVLSRYDIPFFHMTDCAAYEMCEPYKSLGRIRCIDLATELIEVIKSHCHNGFAYCFSPKFYDFYQDPNIFAKDPYSFSVALAHMEIQHSLQEMSYYGEVSYVFEAGHRHQRQARLLLDQLHDDADKLGAPFTYSFQNKKGAVLLQAADILAWQSSTYIKRKIRGEPTRKDFKSLLEIPHSLFHLCNGWKDGKKDPEMTALVADYFPERDDPEVETLIKTIYHFGSDIREIGRGPVLDT